MGRWGDGATINGSRGAYLALGRHYTPVRLQWNSRFRSPPLEKNGWAAGNYAEKLQTGGLQSPIHIYRPAPNPTRPSPRVAKPGPAWQFPLSQSRCINLSPLQTCYPLHAIFVVSVESGFFLSNIQPAYCISFLFDSVSAEPKTRESKPHSTSLRISILSVGAEDCLLSATTPDLRLAMAWVCIEYLAL
jgi:hypothetical protein